MAEPVRAVPDDLHLGPQGPKPPPPVETAAQVLPFHKLEWEDFERLCHRLALLEGNVEHAQRFGVRGQSQSGIDIYSRLRGGDYATYQCKRLEAVGDSDIKNAVSKFLGEEWAPKSSRFVFCTSLSMVRRERALAIEDEANRLREHQPNTITFQVWDADSLSVKLKAHPELVEDFFGTTWLERFLPGHVERRLSEQVATLQETLDEFTRRPYQRVRVVTLDWAPERLQRELRDLQQRDPDRFADLTAQVGTPPDSRLVEAAITAVPPWLQDADADLMILMARIAESVGEWPCASVAWERAAEREDGADDRARSLMSAAAASHVGGDDDRRDQLVATAREVSPDHPRIALEDISDEAPGGAQLDRLEQLTADDPDDKALLAGRSALASLLLPDTDKARSYLRVVEDNAPGSALAEALAVSITVQDGRLAVIAGRPLDSQGLRKAQVDALRLRDRLLRECRYEESARLLMLASDAVCLLGERERGAELLDQAEPGELDAPTGRIVLADAAASRALDFRLGLRLIGDIDGTTADRIRAECLAAVGSAAERSAALSHLDAIVAAGGDEAAEAAFIRLAETLGGRRTPWSDEAARFLREHGYERAAVIAEAFYLARWHADYGRADELLSAHLPQTWAKVTRLRLAMQRGWRPLIRETAEDLLSDAPIQAFRLDAGRGLGQARERDRAKEVLLGVARDPSAPPVIRAQAYRLLMRLVGAELEDWPLAAELHKEWVALAPGDTQASMWAPTVASRLRAHVDRPGFYGDRVFSFPSLD